MLSDKELDEIFIRVSKSTCNKEQNLSSDYITERAIDSDFFGDDRIISTPGEIKTILHNELLTDGLEYFEINKIDAKNGDIRTPMTF